MAWWVGGRGTRPEVAEDLPQTLTPVHNESVTRVLPIDEPPSADTGGRRAPATEERKKMAAAGGGSPTQMEIREARPPGAAGRGDTGSRIQGDPPAGTSTRAVSMREASRILPSSLMVPLKVRQ